MNDPHVNEITYILKTPEDVTFEKCPAFILDDTTHKFVLENNILTCLFKTHFPDLVSAKAFIEPILRAWEIHTALQFNDDIHFIYKDANIIDRNPIPNSVSIISASANCNASAFGNVKISVTRSVYPSPPSNFTINPDVETLWFRYNLYLQDKDSLLSMAYFCLSFLEGLARGRHKITSIFCIERDVLNKLGYLTSERGDKKTARKGKDHSFIPLTAQEENWIKACVKTIIRRLGEPYQSTLKPSMIKMSDLPKL